MISYTKRHVNIVSLIITILVFLFISKSSFFLNNFDFQNHQISKIFKRDTVLAKSNANDINQETEESSEIRDNHSLNTNLEENQIKDTNWKIIIPEISLEANISEGTSKEIMDKYVGHFEETSFTNGNIGLAAHNRGYPVNYFAQIKKLKEGDEIIYKYKDFEKRYIVSKNIIIADTDWSYLEGTEDNRITLITCVENEPEYRRCIVGIEHNEGG